MAACKFFNLKKTFIVLAVVILLVTVKLFDRMGKSSRKSAKRRNEGTDYEFIEPVLGEYLKVFHLDLKGGPPKISYLLSVLPLIRRSGANAILIEYEDMFPFSGRLRNVSASNTYSMGDVKRMIEFAEALKMEVIPLVQTFGHLEYVLKLEEFQHLRELESFPQEICPMNKEAVDLVKEMIRQVMAVHMRSRYIHIGCDEVRHVGACSRCSRINYKVLFSRHVTRIAEYVRNTYPGVTPLIWDDMLRRWTYHDLETSGLGESVQPVVWVYGSNIFTLVPPFVWNVYQNIFPKIWAASAFKGAFGETETLPNLSRHLENHLSWVRLFSREDKDFAFKPDSFSGIFLTGWSRYDHFAVLCELLPVGIPSLVLGLTFLEARFANNPSEGIFKWLSILECPSSFLSARKDGMLFQDKLGNCSFPGSDLYEGMIRLQALRARIMQMRRRVENGGWTSRYNLRRNFTSPWRVLEMFPEEGFAGEMLRKELYRWKTSFLPLLRRYFDKDTENEWEEQNIRPLEERLLEIEKSFQSLIRRKTWPRRPIR